MTSSYKDPLAVQDVGDDEENAGDGPVMQTACCADHAQDEDNKNGPMEKADVDVRMTALPPGTKLPRGQKNTPASHTGPKGVIKDFNIAKQNLQNLKMMERLRAEDALNKKATGTRQLVDTSEAPVAAPKPARKTADSDGDTDSDLDDENDEAIFAQYKQQRVADIQATLPRYGVHARVDVTQLTTIVKHENPYVYVVVHLYQNHIEACGRINIALEELARQFPFVHFVRIRSTEAMPNYPDAGLPTLVVYRNGKQVKEFVRVTDQLKADKGGISEVTLARLLAASGILKVPNGLDDPDMKLVEDHFKSEAAKKPPSLVVSIASISLDSNGDKKQTTAAPAPTTATATAAAPAPTASADSKPDGSSGAAAASVKPSDAAPAPAVTAPTPASK